MLFLTPALIVNLSFVVGAVCPSAIDIVLPDVIEPGTSVPVVVNASNGGISYDVYLDGKRTLANRTKSTTTVKLGQRTKELRVRAWSVLEGCEAAGAERRAEIATGWHLPSTRSALPWLIALLACIVTGALLYGERH